MGCHQQISLALGVTPRLDRGALIAQTADLLIRERDERDRRTVLLVDEAHLLDPGQLEQPRILTNSAMDADSLLAVVLLGQPTLRRLIRRGPYAALDQRIATRYHLGPLDGAQTGGCIRHHLTIAGRSDPLFADDAIAAIGHAARGLPRQIGNLAVAALIAGYTRRNTIIDHDCATAGHRRHPGRLTCAPTPASTPTSTPTACASSKTPSKPWRWSEGWTAH